MSNPDSLIKNRHIPASVLLLATSLMGAGKALAADSDIQVSPPHWWADMASPSLELMLHGDDIADDTVTVTGEGVTLVEQRSLDSDNYLFVALDVENTVPGKVTLSVTDENGQVKTLDYSFKARDDGSAQRQGFSAKDAIYLITPDRFANGDTSNDNVSGYRDKQDRSDKGGRHGGDIAGMMQHLDYISDMGFTQIWTMPLLENAMEKYSYHGYSTTDYYRIDPRFGSNQLYRQFSERAAKHGVGVIMDMILNHIGSDHPWMRDMPSSDWIHNGGEFTPTSHRRESLHDPHGVESDIRAFADGWFVPTMPDLNQSNPHLATYLIQNAIWWVEYAGLSGIRVDTYSYSDKAFLAEWTRRLMQEYPNLNIVGEEWSTNPAITAYWQQGSQRHDDYQSALPSVMDFPLQSSLMSALTQSESWDSGLRVIYDTLATDFLYGDPYNLVVFADNHDMSRVFSQLNEDKALWDIAMTVMLTTRGIPQVFYGTEILMANPGTTDHGIIRSDFPGGWQGDEVNAFSGKGLTDDQRWAQQRIKQLLSLRKSAPELFAGELVHYAPDDGVYVYFRTAQSSGTPGMMVVVNKGDARSLDLSRFEAQLSNTGTMTRLRDNKKATTSDSLSLDATSASVWLLN
ncbi:glycoside hydrolase family 13 protein [Alteromonas halophila]|uniref:Neopullulanase SusA n=1 Tax=Alteromonas halophila TaxID=516698 RepID=A0A918N009_9ALTE|nr:glycoside hydrolase family 13 protein [Alteromonas halophila]GGW88161.1 neopullulanase SusA [Alteromonas halophila]